MSARTSDAVPADRPVQIGQREGARRRATGWTERLGRLASVSCHALSLRRTRTMVGMRGRVGGIVCAGALVLAGEAKAAPMALLDAPRATAVAVGGSKGPVGPPASPRPGPP